MNRVLYIQPFSALDRHWLTIIVHETANDTFRYKSCERPLFRIDDRSLDGANFCHFRDVIAQHVLNAVLQGGC